MKKKNIPKINQLVNLVNNKIKGIEYIAQVDSDRAYGGIIRAAKGKLLEELCKELFYIAWNELKGNIDDLSFPTNKIPIPLNINYLSRIKSTEIRNWINDNYKDFIFRAQVDIHTFVKDEFAVGIECKSYTENAMLKRVLVDFTLLKTIYPNLKCVLFQLESQLTGDYSEIDKKIIYGSHSTHTLLSYFDIDLEIMTLVKGERKVDEPIHQPEFFKPIAKESLIKSVEKFIEILKPYK